MSGYQVDAYAQFITALIAAGAGMALCLAYDLLRLIRYACRPSVVGAFVQDIVWWLLATVTTCLVLLTRCSGTVRFYPLLSMAVGFITCRFTVSLILMRLGKQIVDIIKGIIGWINQKVFAPIIRLIASVSSKFTKIIKKFIKTVKNLLKDSGLVVYNQLKSWAKMPDRKRSKSDV